MLDEDIIHKFPLFRSELWVNVELRIVVIDGVGSVDYFPFCYVRKVVLEEGE